MCDDLIFQCSNIRCSRRQRSRQADVFRVCYVFSCLSDTSREYCRISIALGRICVGNLLCDLYTSHTRLEVYRKQRLRRGGQVTKVEQRAESDSRSTDRPYPRMLSCSPLSDKARRSASFHSVKGDQGSPLSLSSQLQVPGTFLQKVALPLLRVTIGKAKHAQVQQPRHQILNGQLQRLESHGVYSLFASDSRNWSTRAAALPQTTDTNSHILCTKAASHDFFDTRIC